METTLQITIESLKWKELDLSSCSQGLIQPRNSHRLGHIRDGGLIAHNCRVYETVHDAAWLPHSTPSDRGVGLAGAQLLNNLQLNPLALLAPSPFRGNLVHLNISGCQSINTGAIDTLLRLSYANLPKLQRIHMEGLRLELCQRAAKSFLRERLGTLDSLGTMGAFTLGQNGQTTTSMRGRSANIQNHIPDILFSRI